MNKRLLILSPQQFGYLTDTFKYCQYSGRKFTITYVGWDYKKPRITVPGVNVIYVSRESNIVLRNLNLLRAFQKQIRCGYDVVFANYCHGISFLRILNLKANIVLDIRSACVNPRRFKRIIYDLAMKFEVLFFKNISVISDGVAKKLNLSKYHLLPLGGECFTTKPKNFEKLSFLYVGTLHGRQIIDCIKGFHYFIKNFDLQEKPPVLTIIGDSVGNELLEIKEYVKRYDLFNNIIIKGYVPASELGPFFESSNVGISYIPLKSYFQHQPPTKTFEYLVSGLAVIATATAENKKIINRNSGILIEDTSFSFYNGLKKIYTHRKYLNSNFIRESNLIFSWKRVAYDNFIPLMESLARKNAQSY